MALPVFTSRKQFLFSKPPSHHLSPLAAALACLALPRDIMHVVLLVAAGTPHTTRTHTPLLRYTHTRTHHHYKTLCTSHSTTRDSTTTRYGILPLGSCLCLVYAITTTPTFPKTWLLLLFGH